MSVPFPASLRARKETIRLAPDGVPAITIRVEMPDVWDVVRIEVLPSDQVLEVKTRALEALFPEAQFTDDFVMKLRGWEILDETMSLSDAGVIDLSILLVTHRRRRPVR
jgi:hypothetical protein